MKKGTIAGLVFNLLFVSTQIALAQTPTNTPTPSTTPTATPTTNVFFVSIDGSNSNDGRTSETAWRTITYACSVSNTDTNFGDTIKVLQGTYSYIEPSSDPVTGPTGETFPIEPKSGLTIIGTSSPLSKHLEKIFVTKINAFKDYPDPYKSARSVFSISYKHHITIQNFKITGAYIGAGINIVGSGTNYINIFNNYIIHNYAIGGGAGIALRSTNPKNYEIFIKSNYIIHNGQIALTIPKDFINDGGGIGITYSSPTIEGNTIEHNFAVGHGAGINVNTPDGWHIPCEDLTSGISRVIIRNNKIRWNYCLPPRRISLPTGDGGGIRLDCCSEAIIEDNVIEYNWAVLGAGIWVFDNSSAIIRRNIIRNNISIGNYDAIPHEHANGAGIAIGGNNWPVTGDTTGTITIYDNVIYENEVRGYSYGITVTPTPSFTIVPSITPEITRTPLVYPTVIATFDRGNGSAIWAEGSTTSSVKSKQKIIIANNLIYDNYAGDRGA